MRLMHRHSMCRWPIIGNTQRDTHTVLFPPGDVLKSQTGRGVEPDISYPRAISIKISPLSGAPTRASRWALRAGSTGADVLRAIRTFRKWSVCKYIFGAREAACACLARTCIRQNGRGTAVAVTRPVFFPRIQERKTKTTTPARPRTPPGNQGICVPPNRYASPGAHTLQRSTGHRGSSLLHSAGLLRTSDVRRPTSTLRLSNYLYLSTTTAHGEARAVAVPPSIAVIEGPYLLT